jgi:hypothetical protein
MSGELMDQAIQAMDGKQWALATLDKPTSPIAAADFLSGACRKCSKAVKSMNVIFDAHIRIPPCGIPAELAEQITSNVDHLPAAVKFKASLPPKNQS